MTLTLKNLWFCSSDWLEFFHQELHRQLSLKINCFIFNLSFLCRLDGKYCSVTVRLVLVCFDVYSMSAVNATESAISREDIFSMLKHCLVKQPTEEDPDEGVKDLVELMLKKMVSRFNASSRMI